MQTEVTSLRESLRQKKELAAHLRQSAMEARRESDRKEAALGRQIGEMKEAMR
jgi:hypothetical protein